MNGMELDAAIEQANRIFSRQYAADAVVRRNAVPAPCDAVKQQIISTKPELRFGQAHARLFPFIGRKVRTPNGAGTLIQVFAERVTVLLDSGLGRCTCFEPASIEPITWELP